MSNRFILSVCLAVMLFFGGMIVYPIIDHSLGVDNIVDFFVFSLTIGLALYLNLRGNMQ